MAVILELGGASGCAEGRVIGALCTLVVHIYPTELIFMCGEWFGSVGILYSNQTLNIAVNFILITLNCSRNGK